MPGWLSKVGSQVGVMASPWYGISPKLVTRPSTITGRTTQKVGSFGGIDHPVGSAPAAPSSVTLQSVEPWSNTQLWPPPVSGRVGSLFSETEVSGTHMEAVV